MRYNKFLLAIITMDGNSLVVFSLLVHSHNDPPASQQLYGLSAGVPPILCQMSPPPAAFPSSTSGREWAEKGLPPACLQSQQKTHECLDWCTWHWLCPLTDNTSLSLGDVMAPCV